MDNSFTIIVTAITTVLTLANIFQWFDRRAKDKALQNFLEAIHDMAKRSESLNEELEIKQKSQDICSVVNAAIATVSGRKLAKPFFPRRANKGRLINQKTKSNHEK